MKILGIDPGLGRCGWAIITREKNKYQMIEYGCIETSSKLSDSERLVFLKQELDRIIVKFKPDVAVVEQLFFFKNQKTIIQVGQARGIILLAIAEKSITLQELTPLQVKMSLTGYGKADKSQIQKMVKVILKLEIIPKPDDAADALAIALAQNNDYSSKKNKA